MFTDKAIKSSRRYLYTEPENGVKEEEEEENKNTVNMTHSMNPIEEVDGDLAATFKMQENE